MSSLPDDHTGDFGPACRAFNGDTAPIDQRGNGIGDIAEMIGDVSGTHQRDHREAESRVPTSRLWRRLVLCA